MHPSQPVPRWLMLFSPLARGVLVLLVGGEVERQARSRARPRSTRAFKACTDARNLLARGRHLTRRGRTRAS
jgi:hypothetical protein